MTQDELKSRLHYNPDTGVFTWLDNPCAPLRWRNRYVGTRAGSVAGNGYTLISINKKRHYAHRLAFLYVHGFMPKGIDHIDGDPLNNKASNLRSADQSENTKNLAVNCKNTSGRMGVAWDKSRNKWTAYINLNGRKVEQKRFNKREDADDYRDRLEIKYGYHENHGKRKSPS